MIWLALLAAAATPEHGPWDKYSGPYKLIVVHSSSSSIAITDYPSLARCEAARSAIAAAAERENAAHPPRYLPGGGTIITPQLNFRTLCIPG